MQKKKKKDVEKDEQMNIASFLIRNKPAHYAQEST